MVATSFESILMDFLALCLDLLSRPLFHSLVDHKIPDGKISRKIIKITLVTGSCKCLLLLLCCCFVFFFWFISSSCAEKHVDSYTFSMLIQQPSPSSQQQTWKWIDWERYLFLFLSLGSCRWCPGYSVCNNCLLTKDKNIFNTHTIHTAHKIGNKHTNSNRNRKNHHQQQQQHTTSNPI